MLRFFLGRRVRVPADALYRAQTQRAVENFPIWVRPQNPPAFGARPREEGSRIIMNQGAGHADTQTIAILCRIGNCTGKYDAHFY